jgi:two-component system, NtrC family, sensor histidine kinase HydH
MRGLVAPGVTTLFSSPSRYSQAVRPTIIVPLVVLLVTGVLAVSLLGLRYERGRLLADFAADQHLLAGQLGSDLARELDELDDDARLVASLLRPGAAGDPADETRLLQSAFQALATVVRHHRAVSLFRYGDLAVKAIDPTEAQSAARAFADWSVRAAAAASDGRQAVLDGPREGPDGRQFFIYARPTSTGEVVVLVSEARYLLQPVLRSRSALARYLLLDPARSLWIGCMRPSDCRALNSNEWRTIPGLARLIGLIQVPDGETWDTDEAAAVVGLGARSSVMAWQTLVRGGRPWLLAVIASAQPIESRERTLMWWLLATGAGLTVALGTVGVFMIRHHRRAAALQERLGHAQEAAQLRERTEKLIENVSVGLIGVTGAGRIVLTNRFLVERVAPLTTGGTVFEALAAGDEDAGKRLQGTLAEALQTGRPRAVPEREVPLLALKPGHFDLRIIPLKQPAQDVSALILIEDLSELKSLEKQLVRAEKLITVGVLTAGLAHEIGTPLGIIRGRAELLLTRITDASVAHDLESIIRQIDQIGSTIRQVLDFAHAQPVEFRPVEGEEAVRSALTMLDWRMRQKNLFIRVDCERNLPPLAADADQLQQVLVNLLLNAWDACDADGSVQIRLRSTEDDDRVVLQIKDDGCGIAASDLNAVFDPFYTTKKRGEGTGLGLPVAASIVRNHSGEIAIQSRKGAGTTVTITWPTALEGGRSHAPAARAGG